MCKSYDLVPISVACCAELDKNENKRAATVISITTWPHLQQPSPQLDIKPANIPQNMTSALTSTSADYSGPKAGVSGSCAEQTASLFCSQFLFLVF